jgi:AcrR family transcriptional regulator
VTPPKPSTTRDQILEWAVVELGVNGSEFFNTTQLCDELHVSRSLINHHFGNHMGLVAEAAVTSYERYVQILKDAAAAKDTPSSRLEAWMEAQHQWFVEYRGTAALLQLPHPTYANAIANRWEGRLKKAFRLNMAVLATLVKDVQDDTVTALDFDEDTAPFAELLSQSVETLMRTASVGMSSMGASVWAAGHTMPSRDVDENYLQEASLTQHRKWVTRAIIATR